MASQVTMDSSQTSPKLPALREGQSSLVCQEQLPSPPTPRDQAQEWAKDVRIRIRRCLENEQDVTMEDMWQLKQELIPVFVICLQQDSRHAWLYLTEVMSLVEPYSSILSRHEIKAELYHYVERLVHHVQVYKEKMFDLHVIEALQKVFPKEVEQIQSQDKRKVKNYSNMPVVKFSTETPTPSVPKLVPNQPNMKSLPNGANPYSMFINTEEQIRQVKPLTFGDLRKSLANVAVDMAARESIWSHSLGPVAKALQTDIPDPEHDKLIAPSPEIGDYKLTPRSGLANFTAAERKFKHVPKIVMESVPEMNGREAVAYFVKCSHLGNVKSLFFNYATSRHYAPYELVCVLKNHLEPEHFVFSTFGVLHVYPNEPAESQTLSEWLREAVLWKAVSYIPFFKNYLIKKMFDRWRSNKLYMDYLRKREAVSGTLLQSVPVFGAALLQILRLLKELITVTFLPFDIDKMYQLMDFENNINYKNIQAEKILEKFFTYCRMVVEKTAEESFNKLRYCEEQVRKKTYFSKDSLHMQQYKKEQREKNLQLARSETGRLGNFVKLVDQMIVEHMFYLTKHQVTMFVTTVIRTGQSPLRDGFLKANLVFTKHDILGISPSRGKFTRVLGNTLKGIPSVLCANAVPMDGSITEPQTDIQTVGENGGRDSGQPKSEPNKSTSDMRGMLPERRKSTAATSSVKYSESRTQMSGAVSQLADSVTAVSTVIQTARSRTAPPPHMTTSMVGDDEMSMPEMPFDTTKSKDQDAIGVATPDLVVTAVGHDLVVEGEGFMGQYQPLSRASLEEKLDKDEDYQEMLGLTTEVLNEAMEEIDSYCDFNKWLNEIHLYCKRWNDKSAREFKGEQAFTIEAIYVMMQKLTELRQWAEKVRNFDHNFHTANGLFFVDCSHIHDNLLPRLNDIYSELVSFVADEARDLANGFCLEMKTVIENMKDKQPDVDKFATYAKNYNTYKKCTPTYQQRVEYIKSLYEVIRMSYRQLTAEEEKFEENVWAAWEAFLLQMQDAAEFVNTQTPLMSQLLEDTYQRLEREACALEEEATSDKFLDGDEDPTEILIDMKRIRDKFFDVQAQLQKASKWRESICGEPYNLWFLDDLNHNMDVRQEVWKYMEVSENAIYEWRMMLLKKMNIRKALEKIIEWQSVAAQLKPHLLMHDLVLRSWCLQLAEFKKDFSVLHKLANDALKERHWKAIFVGMNKTYDKQRNFTVADLLTYNLDKHAKLVHQIYLGAVAEYDLELKIGHMKKFWQDREFKLAKHIPDSLLASKDSDSDDSADEKPPSRKMSLFQKRQSIAQKRLSIVKKPSKKPSSPRRRSKLEKYRLEKASRSKDNLIQGLNVAEDDYYVLIEVEDLKYQLEDSQITIRGMMESPYLGDMAEEVASWYSALQQVEEITDLWFICQKKWMYLLKVFEWPELYRRFLKNAPKFGEVHTKLKDWMRVVSNDSKVLTVINRRRGEKGYRLFQGDNLRALFLELIQAQEEILKDLSCLLEDCRMEFSRLYFLSDEELVEMLAVSRNPQALTPFAKKCFPGINSLAFALPPGTSSLNTNLDFALHADKLQVIALRGRLGEEVPFLAHLEAQGKSTIWLKLLEGIMKNTVATFLQSCVQTRIEEGDRVQAVHILDELTATFKNKDEGGVSTESIPEDLSVVPGDEIKHQFQHWLLRFPAQCVFVTEGILWERAVSRALEKPEVDLEELKSLRSHGNVKLDQCIDILKDMHSTQASGDLQERLHCLITTLVTQNIEHRDSLNALLSENIISEKSFTWLRQLRYHMDVRNVLRAKQEPIEPCPPPGQAEYQTPRTRVGRSVTRRTKKEDEVPLQASLSRTKTSVTTDFQFSRCSIQQLSNSFHYDYEYQGPCNKLVQTPLTERAYLSLTQALKNFHCGTLIGPPGVGKSETVKDLAKMFGCCLYTINCNSEITLPMMTQYMMGMVQSGCWTLFDDTDRLTKGLMSVTAQQLDQLRTAFRTLDISSENQYKIRGQPRADKKTGVGDAVIRRNSLTTLHPLPHSGSTTQLERQKTVPHGFNEKGLVTYFEETWIAEKEQRRHSIEREIEIQESELYNKNKPPPLFYDFEVVALLELSESQHARFKGKKASPDYSKLLKEAIYKDEYLGNIMFNGKLMQANVNFGCFMTLNTTNPAADVIPEAFRVLLRPCAMIVPDLKPYIEVTLLCNGYHDFNRWAHKLSLFAKLVKMQLPRKTQYMIGMKEIKMILHIAVHNLGELHDAREHEKSEIEEASRQLDTKIDTPPLVSMDSHALEEQSLVQAILDCLQPELECEDDVAIFLNILRDVFPISTKSKSASGGYHDAKLLNAVRDQLAEDNMKETQEVMDKILQLYAIIQQRESVILTGASGSGKSTCLSVLSRALNRLNYLLFAPDHSKDELATDREMMFHTKQKLQAIDEPELLAAEEDFLSKIGGVPKSSQSYTGGKRYRRMPSMLARVQEAIHEMEVKKSPEYAMYPKIDLVNVNPTALSSEELLGYYENGLWQGGLLQKILHEANYMSDAVKTYLKNYKKQEQSTNKKQKAELPSVLLKWVVLDGVLHPNWTEGLNTVLDSERQFSMANGGRVPLSMDNTQILFEATDMSNMSPSTIAHCNMIHFGDSVVSWSSLFECWAKTAKSQWIFTSRCMKVIISLAHDVFGPTIKFLTAECTTALLTDVGHSVAMANRVIPGVQEMTAFIMMYSALLDRGFSRDEFEKKISSREPDEEAKVIIITRHLDPSHATTPSSRANSRMTNSSQIESNLPNYMEQMKGMFAISYIWAFGGHLHDRHREKFNKFAHDVLYRARHKIKIPLGGTVYDYCMEPATGAFIRWNQKAQERSKTINQSYVVTPEVEKYTYLIELLVNANHPVLLTGQSGVGKSSLINNMVLPKQTPSTSVMMSPGMTAAIFQETLMAHILDLKSKAMNVITAGPGAASNKPAAKHLFFIDDLNTASKESGYQPPLELLTQLLTQGGVYDRKRQKYQVMKEAGILAAATLPTCPGVGMGESTHVMSSRLTRQFMNITLFFPSADGILSTFGRNIQHWLEEFPTVSVAHHFEYARALTLGLLELYQKVKERFRPTPAHAHYVFSLHDISRVVQGILLMSPRTRTRKMMKIRKEKRQSQSQQSLASRGHLSSTASLNASLKDQDEGSPPMMKVIAQLWCHECTRTFGDRLVNDEDCQWYSKILEEIVNKQFCSPREDPKVEMAMISEETFSQTGPFPSPRITPTTYYNEDVPQVEVDDFDSSCDDSDEDEDEDDEDEEEDDEEDEEEAEESGQQTQAEDGEQTQEDVERRRSDGSVKSQGNRRSGSAASKASKASDTSSSARLNIENGEGETSEETEEEEIGWPDSSGRYPMASSDVDTDESETLEDSDSESDTETETMTGTPRDLMGTQATTVDESSRGTSTASDNSYPTEDYVSTTSSEVETAIIYHTSRRAPDVKSTKFADDYGKGAVRFKRQYSKTSQAGAASRRVHFKPGLMTDKEHIAYFGPLMKMEEIKGSQETLTEFIFSKFYMTTHTETLNLSVEKGYLDTTEESLGRALQTCLNVYNIGTSQRLELVFFKEAIHHAARLSRMLSLQGGHAILLGTSYSTGRATLVRLASYIAHCKLFEPKPQTDVSKNLRIVHEHIKRACEHSGIMGKPTVLLVHEDLGQHCLQDVAALMAQGTSPGLYSEKEIQSIVSQMMPGGVQTKRIDKIEQAFERFIKRIRQNLHVVVCLSYRGNSYSSNFKSLHSVMSKYPNLLKYSCCVDHYSPWPFEAYVTIARVWLQDGQSKVCVPWHPTRKDEQLNEMSRAMAYIHLSSKMALERQYCHQRSPLRFFSPLTFMEFVHIFRIIAAYIVKIETGNIVKHDQALGKVNEAFGSISQFKREVSNLSPQHKAATDEIKNLVEQVEVHKQEYIHALDKCKEQEQLIEALQGPLDALRKEAQSEFDKNVENMEEDLNPNYTAATAALTALNRADLDEVKKYREPPKLVQSVVSALCLLFNKPEDWENGKLMMASDNFIQDLIFYDKDHIPDHIFRKLSWLVQQPDFDPHLVGRHSLAARGICMWIHSIQRYSEIHRNMQPRLKDLLQHEEKFTKAQAKLGQRRVDANRLKSALEKKIQVHKAAVKRAKTILRQMQNIEKKIARAVNLMENMSMQHFMWKSELKKAKHQILTAPGDALVTAACVCYQGPLTDKLRGDLLQDWVERCKQGNFTLAKTIGQDVYRLGNSIDNLLGLDPKDRDSNSDVSSSVFDPPSDTTSTTTLTEIRTYKYQPVVYDTSKYYKSELKRQSSVEYEHDTNNCVVSSDSDDDEEEQSLLITRNAYCLQEILSDFDELSKWRLENLPTDLHSVQNALLMRVSCYNRKHCWPLLIDPDNQAEKWVKAIQTSANIFSEKDVRDTSLDDVDDTLELPPVPSAEDKMGDEDTRPPPSRGTSITFSEYTVEYPADESSTNRTTHTSMTESTTRTDYTKRGESRFSWESEMVRPVTSVAASWETYSLHPDQNYQHPEHNLLIVEADDLALNTKLINAIVHGVTVLITHLERKPIDPLFRGLLLKHFYVDKDGHKVVRVGSYEFKYHPDFCLYLSTSVPPFLKGDGLSSLPIHRMCIINMGLSDEAIINYLLHETMRVERKEFEGQKRSNENDIIRHRQKLAAEHEMIREKTLNLFGPILEDQTMLDSLISCQKEVEKNRMILEETRYMGDHLEEKFSHYVPMIMQAAMLYNMIQRMSVLHSYYYLPFYKYVEMFVGVIRARDRGKGTQGAPASRAKELSDAVFTNVFKYVSMMLFERHFLLLQLLVTLERLRLTKKASAKELGIFLNGFDKTGIDDTSTLLEHKPEWMQQQAWLDCLVLEQVHHAFHGLTRSLIENNQEWVEYFSHPVSLMNTIPGTTMQDLFIFQKCLLWRFACPNRFADVIQALVLFELGNIRAIPDNYNIKEVYDFTSNTTPVVFVLPSDVHDTEADDGTKGLPYVSPSHEVKRLAKEVGMEGKVKVMNFGVQGQMAEVQRVINECIQTGYWLLIQNYHLAEEPDEEFFHVLKDIVYSRWRKDKQGRELSSMQDDTGALVTQATNDTNNPPVKIADTFRLWITTQSDNGRLIPGVLVQHGVRVTAESTGNFKSTLQKSYRSVAFLLNNFQLNQDETGAEKMGRIMPLALLHALLLQQCYYGNGVFRTNHYWSLTDLAMGVDVYKKIMLKCSSWDKVPAYVAQVYTDHCVDATDYVAVRALVETLAKYATMPSDQIPSTSDDAIVTLLKRLLHMDEDTFNLKRAVDSLGELTAATFGLPENADRETISDISSILSRDMVQVIGAPELFNGVTIGTSKAVIAHDALIPQYLTMVQNLPMLPETNRNQMYPIDVFLHYEVEGYKHLIKVITNDLGLLQRKSKGEIQPSPELNDVIYAINRNSVPQSWTNQSFQSARNVSDWLMELAIRLKVLRGYILDDDKPAKYNLSVFMRPDRFLEAVKQTYARKQFKDFDNIEFTVEVMPAGLRPSIPPAEGVYITGLHLHNALWDTTRAVLMMKSTDSEERQQMPVFWLKPSDAASASQPKCMLYKLYRCPVFCSTDTKLHGERNIVVHFSLPSEHAPSVWEHQRAFLTTSMPHA